MYLTKREREVLLHIGDGYSVKEIAHLMTLSHHTIETHKKNLMRKFEALNCTHLGVLAERTGHLSKKSLVERLEEKHNSRYIFHR